MERLNDIMSRTAQRRPHYSEQRSPQSQGQQTQQSQRPNQLQQAQQQQANMRSASRPPLREQNAHQGQQRPYVPQSQPSPATRSQHEPTSYEGRSYGQQPAVRPIPTRPQQSASQRPAMNRSTTYSPQRPERQNVPEQSAVHPLHTRPMYVQHHRPDEYALSPVVSADVVEDWEDEEDDETGMQYGDWEEGESEVVIYQRATPEQHTRSRGMAPTQPRNDYGQVYPQHPLVTRELSRPSSNTGQGYGTRTSRDVQQSQPPTPPVRVQEVQQPHRSTQPLNSHVSTERAITQGQAPQHMQQRPLRQIVPQQKTQMREQAVMPYTTSTALPEVMPLALTKSACPRCKGAGYLRANVPFGHPNFGKPLACECKEAEKKEKRRQQLLELSDLSAFRSKSLANFSTHFPGIHSTVQEAFEVAQDYAQDPYGWLLLVGPNGCGKTHLAAAIANKCLDGGSVVLFAVVPDLLAHLRSTFAPTAPEGYDQLFAKMREAELLVLDDLGSHQSSPWANEKLFQLLNYRYNSQYPTVITANKGGLGSVDDRIISRLSDVALVNTVVMDGAQDYRRRNPRRD